MAGIKDFYRRDTKKYTIRVMDKDGRPICIDGFEFVMTFKERPTDPDSAAAIQVIVTATDNPSDPRGEVEIVLTPTDTDIEPKTYYYDIQMKSTSGDITTLLSGKVKVLQDITHRT